MGNGGCNYMGLVNFGSGIIPPGPINCVGIGRSTVPNSQLSITISIARAIWKKDIRLAEILINNYEIAKTHIKINESIRL